MSETINLPKQGLTLNPDSIKNATEWEEFVSLWTVSQDIDKANQWYKGDIADRVAVIHGEGSLKQFAEEVKESYVTMQHYRRVSRAFPSDDMRNWNLSWTHYLIASFADSFNKGKKQFDSENRFKWLEDAHDNNWTTSRLEAEIKKKGAIKDDKDYYDYYMEQLTKFGNMMLHLEKNKMSPQQRMDLVNKMLDLYNKFQVYMIEQNG